ncbi:hypothetical protein DPMN_068809 [Dreissena polymorpha]|uniref:G-protein coupled receptors family 3 profile domain-containing protein n=1 Tax=Dreissena polymorpha TaxID=45954 RepID=A0A9D3Z2Y0_DREPO|nr:hypothetical protein DPMN_068809 [Dreissena polymorpha]
MIDSEVIVYCHNDKQVYWFITMYVYKGLLLAFGTFLAWETRNVDSSGAERLEEHWRVHLQRRRRLPGRCAPFAYPVYRPDQPGLRLGDNLAGVQHTSCACIIFAPKIHNRNKVRGKMLTKGETVPNIQLEHCQCSRHPSNQSVELNGHQ